MTPVFSTRGLAFWLAISLLVHLPLGVIVMARWEEQKAGDARPLTIQLSGQETRASEGFAPAAPVRTGLSTTRMPEPRPTTMAPPAPTLPVASLSIDPNSAHVTPTAPESAHLPANLATGIPPATTANLIETPIATVVSDLGGAGSASEISGISASGDLGVNASSEASGIYAPPSYANRSDPPYPSQARNNGEEGEVLLKLQIAADGTVPQMTIEHSSGSEDLDRAAFVAVKRWRFHPATRNGIPIEETVRLTLIFRLQSDRPGAAD